MKLNHLKLYAGIKVKESKLSDPAKLQMFKFISEATPAQVKSLIMDSKITKLDEQAEQIVNDRFNAEYREDIEQQIEEGTLASAGSVLGLMLFGGYWALYRAAKGAFKGCTKKCGTFELNTVRRQYCMAVCNLQLKQKQLAAVTKQAGACGQAKDPAKCKEKSAAAISKAKAQVQLAQTKVNNMKAKAAKRGTTAGSGPGEG